MRVALLDEHDGDLDHPMWMCEFAPGEAGGWGLHYHRQHQLAWVAEGLSTVIAGDAHWVVSPARAVWIPGGWPHDIVNRPDAHLYCLYLWPEHAPATWSAPTELAVTPLARELLMGLGRPGLEQPVSEASATVLFAELRRRAHARPSLPMPTDARAAELASALLASPATPGTLSDWARRLATSESTLRRAFLADTGLTFTAWRTQARLDASLALLEDGWSVDRVARRVGYASRSGFVDAFRRRFGRAPAACRRAAPEVAASSAAER